MTKKKVYADDTRAAVMAALLAGQSVPEISREYDIPQSTVRDWRGRIPHISAMSAAEGGADRIGELLLTYLATSLESLQRQVELFGDERWLRQQEASGVAVLHGVQSDKAHRLIELLSRRDDSSTPAS